MKSSGDAIDLFGSHDFTSSLLGCTPKALVILSEALLVIAESNREIAEANNRIAAAIESLAKESFQTPGPLRIIAEAVKEMAEKG